MMIVKKLNLKKNIENRFGDTMKKEGIFMQKYIPITDVYAREIIDSRGNPTLEVEVVADEKYLGRAAVPSGASTGEHEAVELRDNESRYMGKGVLTAVSNVNEDLAEKLIGVEVTEQNLIDQIMIDTDGTENKGNMGANAILGISMAVADAAAEAVKLPLYKYLGGSNAKLLPCPMMNILNGGCHSENAIDFQEFMIMPIGARSFHEALRMCCEVYHSLKKILDDNHLSTAVGDEGGFAPDLKNADEVFEYLTKAVNKAGYETGKDIVFAMDAAASELYNSDSALYDFPGESRMLEAANNETKTEVISRPDTLKMSVSRTTDEMIDYYEMLCNKYPLYSIEDGLDENDWEGWKRLTERIGNKVQLVGDDLFVTNTKRLKQGIDMGVANAILIKVNQIGSLSEAMEAVEMAQKAGYNCVISHRSGETEDTTIADLAVATNAGQIKTGAPCRSERVAKYNQLLRIEEDLGGAAKFECPFCRKGCTQ